MEVIFSLLKLWIAVARHNFNMFKWLKIQIEELSALKHILSWYL